MTGRARILHAQRLAFDRRVMPEPTWPGVVAVGLVGITAAALALAVLVVLLGGAS